MENLCEYLKGETFADRVFKVKDVKPKGNSARFNNLSLYIRREALSVPPLVTPKLLSVSGLLHGVPRQRRDDARGMKGKR
eukprot:1848766-Rhodomonas_salina.1